MAEAAPPGRSAEADPSAPRGTPRPSRGARLLRIPEEVGARTIAGWHYASYIVAVLIAALQTALRPGALRRTVRREFMEQCYTAGAGALPFALLLGTLVGAVVVGQTISWLQLAGQSDLIGRFLMLGVVRYTLPFLVNLILIGRSGMEIVSMLGTMKSTGQVRVLASQGIDPFLLLVVPRVLALPVAAFGLAIAFLCVTIITGYLLALVAGLPDVAPDTFLDRLLAATELEDAAALPFAVLLPAFTTAAICCIEGLGTTAAVTEVSRCLPRAFVRCVATLALVQFLVALVFFT